uniref:ubiquitinyl hydrolase 1 n=1 Tax=Amphimedon queenslandica TaxID=400682 RepID=A0A1X7TEA6_AMPQE
DKAFLSIDKHFPGMCLDITGSRGQEVFKVPLSHTRLFLPEEYGVVLRVEEYAKQRQEANADKWETEIAKKYGLSLEEYRSQTEYMEKAKLANKEQDNHSRKTGGGQEEEGAAGVGTFKNNKSEKDKISESMMHIESGEPLSEERRQQEEQAYELARQQSQHGDSDQSEYAVIKGLEVKPVDNNYLNVDIPERQQDINPIPEDLRKPSPKAHHEEEGYKSLSSNDTPHQRSPNLRRSPDPPAAGYHLGQFRDRDYSNRPHDPSYDHGRNDLHDPPRNPDRHSDLERHRDLPHDSHHPPPPDPGNPSGDPPPDPHRQFTIGSMVYIDMQRGDPLYGVVKWIGTVPDFNGAIAGVEMASDHAYVQERPIKDCTDGTWRGTRFFTCPPGKAYFCPLNNLRQDTRYMDEGQVPAHMRQDCDNPLAKYAPVTEEIDTMGSPDELFHLYTGDGRGIQGHHNSCYLDSTVFGLFALSASFDDLLLEKPTEEVGRKVKYYLWKGIVNPLRKYGLARYESIMDLRDSLEEFGRMKGAKTDEKDPEEFLNLLFKEVLHIPPFLTIKRPFGIEKEFFIQLFFEIDPNNTEVPKTEKLIAQMFHEQNISFTRVSLYYLS